MEQDWKPVTTSHITDLITMQSGKEASQDEVQAAIDDQTSPRTVEVSSRGDFRLNGLSVHIWSAEQIRGEPAFSAVSYGTSKLELQLTNRLLSLFLRTARLEHTGLNGKIHGSDLDFTFPCPANVCRHSKDGEPILSRSFRWSHIFCMVFNGPPTRRRSLYPAALPLNERRWVEAEELNTVGHGLKGAAAHRHDSSSQTAAEYANVLS